MASIRGGVFTRADARACGYDRAAVQYLLRTGVWHTVGRGRYAQRGVLMVVDDQLLYLRRAHAVLRSMPGAVASHQTAAGLHGLPLWGLDLSAVHLSAPFGRAGRLPGGVRRHVCELPAVHEWNGLRLARPDRAVAEVAATAPAEAATVVAEAALAAGLVSPATLTVAVASLESGRTRARSVLSGTTDRSCSVGESRLRFILRQAGLPSPADRALPLEDVQYGEWEGPALWFPDQRTVVEFDPWQPYWGEPVDSGDPAEPEPPPAEQVWVPWADLDHPDLVADRVRSAFARAAARSGVRQFDPSRRRTGRRPPARATPGTTDLPC